MLPEQLSQTIAKRRVRFPGIVMFAKELGVSRIHLWYVLRGDRQSPGLLKRYKKLQTAAVLRAAKA